MSIGSSLSSALPLDRVGKDGSLRLAFERRDERTILTERRYSLPLQVLEPISMDGDGSLLVMLLNPTGGLLGGDHLKTEIDLGAGSHVCLTTPSATKVYRTLALPAVQETSIRVGPGAILEYLPDHVIPHPGSAFHQSLSIEMEAESRAIFLDAFAIGRLARGEQGLFKELVNRITVTFEDRPLFIERARLNPTRQRLFGLGGTEGFGYFATFVLLKAGSEMSSDVIRELERRLAQMPSVLGSASSLSRGGCLVRILAPSAPDLTLVVRSLWGLARQLLLGLPPVDMRK